MNTPAIDHALLTLIPATSEQARLVRKNTLSWFGKWDNLTSTEWEHQDEKIVIDSQSGLEHKRMTTWLLVPRSSILPTCPITSSAGSDTIYSHFETYRLPAVFSSSTSYDTPQHTSVYAIGTVWTPEQHRRKGYARLALQLGHYVLGASQYLPSFPEEWGSPPPIVLGDAAASVLNSDIGTKYYESCTIGTDQPGWKEQGSTITEWDLRDLRCQVAGPDIEGWNWISSLEALQGSASVAVDEAVKQHERASGDSRVTILPTSDIISGHHNRLLLRPPFPPEYPPARPTAFAAFNAEGGSLFVYYPSTSAVSYPPFEKKGKTLCVAQMVGDIPWKVIQETAAREGCQRLEVWGKFEPPSSWPTGAVSDRGDLYSMMAWYRPLQTGEKNAVWLGNGMWIPCRTWNYQRVLAERDDTKEWL
ncbi:uncharacterized protein IL334_004513 [Kwoniella shivajii]|uniref:N-acetyltransferase domain-containing protein n=1 Tax=Kwoniella shivajii TaxID=564305 RepID=A0ABZ1D0H6_9TREE|nr:hypothetical protein IL334_004513 [Kwoniella shivajii]